MNDVTSWIELSAVKTVSSLKPRPQSLESLPTMLSKLAAVHNRWVTDRVTVEMEMLVGVPAGHSIVCMWWYRG